MNAGLRWWHEVCKEVRASAKEHADEDFKHIGEEGYRHERADEDLRWVVECAVAVWDGHYAGTGTASNSLRDREYKFLRTAWLSAYRKARAAGQREEIVAACRQSAAQPAGSK